MQMGLAQAQAMGKVPPEAKQNLEMLNLVSAIELTLNVSAPGPTSLIIHCNDEAGAQKVETTVQESLQKLRAANAAGQPAGADPISQAMERYKDRVSQLFQPQRTGNSVTCIHIDGQNPAQQQFAAVGLIGLVVAGVMPAIQAARNASMRPQAAPAPGAGAGEPPGGPAPPGAPGAAPQQ